MGTIEDIRRAKGYTQERVAKTAGIAVSSYNQYETGARSVPADVAQHVADVLGVEVSDIFLPKKFAVRDRYTG